MYKKISKFAAKALLISTVFDHSLTASTVNADSSLKLKALGSQISSKTFLVKFKEPLTSSQKEKFYQTGVDTIVYASDMSYYFYMPVKLISQIMQSEGVVSVDEPSVESKVEKISQNDMDLAAYSNDSQMNVNVLFLKEFAEAELRGYLLSNAIEAYVEKVIPELRKAVLVIDRANLKKLSRLALVQYIDKVQKLLRTDSVELSRELRNYKIAEYSNVKELWSAPYSLNGKNMKIGVVDGGSALVSHDEFKGRVHDRTRDAEVNFHATHVTGTLAAEGVNSRAKGMASKAEVYSYSFIDDAFSEAVLNMYKAEGILFSNHSYGYSQKEKLAEYDSVAATQDMVVKNNPFVNIFEAAGNDGEDDGYRDYGIIKGPGNSKNIFTIGALNSSSTEVAKLSSSGPVRDGRIKPDLCVRGEYVTSATSQSNSSYAMMSGTSMATPAATGMGVLVAEEYKRITGGEDIRHDTLKAIFVNTAKDIGNPGPDYKAGFGMIDAKAAVDVVDTLRGNDPLITLSKVSHKRANNYSFTTIKPSDFKLTIAWIDPEATPSATTTLVNDIDIVLENTDTSKKYYPYTLDPNDPSKNAQRTKPNHVDNIEQIEIKNLPAGNYRLIVSGTKIVTDSQEYTIASSLPIFENSFVNALKPSNLQNFARTILMATL